MTFGTQNGEKSTQDSASTTAGGYYQSITQKTKLILPTAVWILIALASLCFLCLLSSLNRTLNSLDAVIEKNDIINGNHHHNHAHSLQVEPSAKALIADDGAAEKATPDATNAQDRMFGEIDKAFKSIIENLPKGEAGKPVAGRIIVSRTSSLPSGAEDQFPSLNSPPFGMLDKLFGGQPNMEDLLGPVETGEYEDDDDESRARGPSAPFINANIDKININIKTGLSSDDNHQDEASVGKPIEFGGSSPLQMSSDKLSGGQDLKALAHVFESAFGINEMPQPPSMSLVSSLSSSSPFNQPKHRFESGISNKNRVNSLEDLLLAPFLRSSVFDSLAASPLKTRNQQQMAEESPILMVISSSDGADDELGHQHLKSSATKKQQQLGTMPTTKSPFFNNRIPYDGFSEQTPLFRVPLSPYELPSFHLEDIDIPALPKSRNKQALHSHSKNKDTKNKDKDLTGNDSLDSALESIVTSLFPFEPIQETAKFYAHSGDGKNKKPETPVTVSEISFRSDSSSLKEPINEPGVEYAFEPIFSAHSTSQKNKDTNNNQSLNHKHGSSSSEKAELSKSDSSSSSSHNAQTTTTKAPEKLALFSRDSDHGKPDSDVIFTSTVTFD